MTSKMTNKLNFSIKESIGYLILSTPPKNEMDHGFFDEFNEIICQLKVKSEIIGLIISSKGRHFSSGANVDQLLSLFNDHTQGLPEKLQRNKKAFEQLNDLPFPVVSCIKGICYGSGLELALSSHFRIAASNALVQLPEAGFGIIPGLGGLYNAQKCIGTAKTIELSLSGNSMTADDALSNGLIDIIADKKHLISKAEELINSIGENYRKELKQIYLLEHVG